MSGIDRGLRMGIVLAAILAGCIPLRSAGETDVLSGFLEGATYTLSAQVGGTVAGVLVEQGQEVDAGQVLIEFDAQQISLGRQQVLAKVAAARADLLALESDPSAEQLARSRAALAAAQSELQTAISSLELLEASYLPLDPPEIELHQAQGAVAVARAGVDLAQALLEQLQAGAHPISLIAARAALAQAEIELEIVDLQIDRLTLTSPIAGVVRQILEQPGSVAQPGTPLVMISDVGDLKVTVYLAAGEAARLSVGDPVSIQVDAYPGEPFPARISHIADRAQFTPTGVQTSEERARMVLAVQVSVENPDGRLKAGMPADVRLSP